MRMHTHTLMHTPMYAGLSNPIDTVFHLQPVMIITLLPLAIYVDGLKLTPDDYHLSSNLEG